MNISSALMPDGKTRLVNAALEYATFAHAGQFRRDGITPYIEHPKRVAKLLAGLPDEIIAVAYLHDIIEDANKTGVDLLDRGFPVEVVRAVKILTKTKGIDYDSYLSTVAKHPVARLVKIADMLDNLTDSPTPKQVERYTKGIMYFVAK